MNKFFYIITLYFIINIVSAKVEIWQCDIFNRGEFNIKYKIDTSIPQVFIKVNKEWTPYYYKDEYKKIVYSSKKQMIWWLNNRGKMFEAFDLEKKINLYYNTISEGITYSIPCKL